MRHLLIASMLAMAGSADAQDPWQVVYLAVSGREGARGDEDIAALERAWPQVRPALAAEARANPGDVVHALA